MEYDFKHIESKWQEKWEEEGVFHAVDNSDKPKFYGLVEFPYPSGAGMHVGHIKAYSGLEVVSRKRRLQGYNVLFPIGFDAYGLPTENYAIKTGIHPRKVTDMNIKKFTSQLKRVGFSFDWTRVIDTTEEGYYKWTQWIFLKMFENGLAFRDKTLVNYCPSCKVVLSNEDSQGGKCDICHSEVVQKSKDVWYLRITEYADKLLEGLKHVDYLPNIKAQQEHWIGKSRGAFVNFSLKDIPEKLRIYTTRPDTLFGVTFMVIAPEHPIIDKYKDKIRNMDAIVDYRTECSKKTEFERTQLVKDKTGVKIDGLTAINPVNGREIPVYISDYVMMGYGTGAIMAVPAHDDRDYDFAKKFGIDIIEVIKGGNIDEAAYTGDGEMVNSGFLNGMDNKKDSIKKTIDYLTEKGIGEGGVQYKMKDWAFNRQRYWGEPFPIVYGEDGTPHLLPDSALPINLPDVPDYEPRTFDPMDAESNPEAPLSRNEDWVKVELDLGDGKKTYYRDTNTMPNWAGSCWYYMRYIDPTDTKHMVEKDEFDYWMGPNHNKYSGDEGGVDLYIGGVEHAVLHLLYSRFWHKVLFDLGYVDSAEPFHKLFNQGMIQAYAYTDDRGQYVPADEVVEGPADASGEPTFTWNGEHANREFGKMGKSLKNIVTPDYMYENYGADTFRLYEMSMGPLDESRPWNTRNVVGGMRFLQRLWRNVVDETTGQAHVTEDTPDEKTLKLLNNTIAEVTAEMEGMRPNTAIAKLIVLNNHLTGLKAVPRAAVEPLILMLAPIAPHICEEMWSKLGHAESLSAEPWPVADERYVGHDTVTAVVQIKGKVRAKLEVPVDIDPADLEKQALAAVADRLGGKEPRKVIVKAPKIVSIVPAE